MCDGSRQAIAEGSGQEAQGKPAAAAAQDVYGEIHRRGQQKGEEEKPGEGNRNPFSPSSWCRSLAAAFQKIKEDPLGRFVPSEFCFLAARCQWKLFLPDFYLEHGDFFFFPFFFILKHYLFWEFKIFLVLVTDSNFDWTTTCVSHQNVS